MAAQFDFLIILPVTLHSRPGNRNWTQNEYRTKLVLSLGIVLAINLAVGLYAFQTCREATHRAKEVSRRANQIVTTSLTAQVHFKKQVQEWKNVLLRGYEPELYVKYLNQFHQEEGITWDSIEALPPLLENDSEM
jgi:ribosomal protein L17